MKQETAVPVYRRLITWVKGIGLLTVVGLFAAGVFFWGGFNTAMEWTNREAFCISCHEMQENVYVEYRNTVHYSNRSGVRATCPDCHVPKEWGPKMMRKIQASNEVLHKILAPLIRRRNSTPSVSNWPSTSGNG